jgi:hypothetical protein
MYNSSKKNRMAGSHPSYDKLGMSKERIAKKLSYDKLYQKSKKQVANRMKRNQARKLFLRAGKVKLGDNKDVDHKKSLKKGGSNKLSNLRVRSRRENRGDKTY